MSGIVRLGKAAPAYIDRWKTTCGACNEHFEFTNADLLNELRVHRSSFVCALLARLPGVTLASKAPIVLRYSG